MKTQMNLTPSRVEELRELGVEFTDTISMWITFIDNPLSMDDWEMTQSGFIGEEVMKCLPAPSLQELLEKLPKFITIDGKKYRLVIAYTNKNELTVSYGYGMYMYRSTLLCDSNPLIATLMLLKWVAINHPDDLINKTE